jgi:two-component system, LytTR family, sensor kinase
MASSFLNDLSKVYRHLLQNNEGRLSTVESEMKFIYSYFKLINTRYNEGVELTVADRQEILSVGFIRLSTYTHYG